MDDPDFLDMLELLFRKVELKEQIFAISNSNLVKTKTLDRLRKLNIKLLSCSVEEALRDLKEYLQPEVEQEEGIHEVYVGKKLFR